MKRWKLNEVQELRKEFYRAFGTGINDFYDRLPSLWAGYILIDITRFDGWLRKKCGDYESRGLSLTECVETSYGAAAKRLIDSVTP